MNRIRLGQGTELSCAEEKCIHLATIKICQDHYDTALNEMFEQGKAFGYKKALEEHQAGLFSPSASR